MMNDLKNEKARRFPLRAGLLVVAIGAVAAAGLLQGCGGGGGGGGGGGCADTDIQISWHLVQGGQEVECQPNDTVTVVVDDSSATTADFPCLDHSDVTMGVEGGVTHSISFTLTDMSGTTLSQTSDMGLSVGCGGVSVAPEVEFDLN
jgi:hypothetical protein